MFWFDMDGTLLDSNGIWMDIDREFLKRRNLPYTQEYYEGVAHTILPLAAVFTKEYCQLEESCEEIMAEWENLLQDAYQHIPAKPGVRAYLEQCRREKRRMGLITSSVPEHCRTALRHLNLEQYFDSFIFAQELGLEKGQSEIWRIAAESNHVSPAACTAFDDSPVSCRGAKAAGMRIIGVYDDCFARQEEDMRQFCDVYIKSFQELLTIY